MTKIHIFWLRRDLRLQDNTGLQQALASGQPVQPVFIFDPEILDLLEDPSDARVTFLWQRLQQLKSELVELGSDLWVFYGRPEKIYGQIFAQHQVAALSFNHDYEPQAILRDQNIQKLAEKNGVTVKSYKDQVVFEKSEVLTDAGKPYTVFTPYKRKWLAQYAALQKTKPSKVREGFHKTKPQDFLTLESMGFKPNTTIKLPGTSLSEKTLSQYATERDFPALDSTSRLGLHLRFGTLSPRALIERAQGVSDVWLSELIWREFFMQILFHFPHVEKQSFRTEYDKIGWLNDDKDFEKWKTGMTGYPIVDAGMRELNATGFMHNRVRMVTASFLTKHLLNHWLRGERYFAGKLLDYDLSANNGNWQWAAGSGCDAAPYFRIFNPESQTKKFDAKLEYVRRWVPELGTSKYPEPMVEHAVARERALRTYTKTLKGSRGGSVQ